MCVCACACARTRVRLCVCFKNSVNIDCFPFVNHTEDVFIQNTYIYINSINILHVHIVTMETDAFVIKTLNQLIFLQSTPSRTKAMISKNLYDFMDQ